MNVSVFSDGGELLWRRQLSDGAVSGFTSAGYLKDGVQQQIIDALVAALIEARGQLGRLPLQVVDAVADVGPTAAKVDCHVPVAIAWNRDAGR
jgi:hypothetical protein